jgi:uncharacterized phage protein (TIGR01671 family)
MREIKFRAYDTVSEQLLPVEAIDFRQDCILLNEGDNSLSDTFEMFELMQYTGLKDKNGVDIYEGDNTRRWLKIRNKWEEVQPGVIKWIQCVSAFKCVDKDGLLHCFDNGHLYEVVGNIHDNPDLLEAQP